MTLKSYESDVWRGENNLRLASGTPVVTGCGGVGASLGHMRSQLSPDDAPVRVCVRFAGVALCSVAMWMMLAGCASPAPPRPPSLNLPEPVRDLTAERVGDRVLLRWTTPEKTTDHIPVKGAMTAEICRITPPATNCGATREMPVATGVITTWESLPAALTAEPASLLVFRIRILNANGHGAPSPAVAFVAGGAAPAPVAPLQASSARGGVQLTWSPENTPPARVTLERVTLNPDGSVALAAPHGAGKSGNENPAAPPAPPPHANQKQKHSAAAPAAAPASPAAQEPVKLRSGDDKNDDKNGDKDAGGVVDTTAVRDTSYRYTAQRVRTVMLGGHELTLKSEVSSPVSLTMRDTFPPATPRDLAAAANPAAAKPSIDLSWTAVADTDLAGYLVYRQEISPTQGTFVQLTPTPIAAPGFSDNAVVTGRRYAYHVTAVDQAGNQSPPSQNVQETLREH